MECNGEVSHIKIRHHLSRQEGIAGYKYEFKLDVLMNTRPTMKERTDENTE
jgi:hypothetical protein